jgi:hypothetical protein
MNILAVRGGSCNERVSGFRHQLEVRIRAEIRKRRSAVTQPNWRAIAVFYFLACLWCGPFSGGWTSTLVSWNAWPLPAEIKGLTPPCGPALAAMAVFYLNPQARSRSGSLWAPHGSDRSVVRDPGFLRIRRSCNSVEPFLLRTCLLPACGRLIDLGRGTRLAGFPSRCTAAAGKTSRLPAPSVQMGSLARHLSLERHMARDDFSIGNHSSCHCGPHVCPGISNGTQGLGTSRDGRPLSRSIFGVDSEGYSVGPDWPAIPVWLWIAWRRPKRYSKPIEHSTHSCFGSSLMVAQRLSCGLQNLTQVLPHLLRRNLLRWHDEPSTAMPALTACLRFVLPHASLQQLTRQLEIRNQRSA